MEYGEQGNRVRDVGEDLVPFFVAEVEGAFEGTCCIVPDLET
jgi:hypothetical protein